MFFLAVGIADVFRSVILYQSDGGVGRILKALLEGCLAVLESQSREQSKQDKGNSAKHNGKEKANRLSL